MSHIDRSTSDLWVRIIFATIPLGICWWVGRENESEFMRVFFMFPGLMATALIIYPSFTAAVGFQVSRIYFPHDDHLPPPTPFTKVDLLLYREEWEQAEVALLALGRTHSHDRRVWWRLFELVWFRRNDPDRAGRCHLEALRAVGDAADWPKIDGVYAVHAQRVLDEETWQAEQERMKERARIVAGERTRRRR